MISIQRILCPVDFSEATPFAISPAVSLATEYDADFIVLHVLNFPYPHVGNLGPAFDLTAYYDQMEEEALRRLQELVDEETREYVSPQALVRRGTPYQEIVRVARDEEVDLVVLPTHGRTGVDRLLFGSVAEKVVRLAPCPVLTVSPRQKSPRPFQVERVLYATDFSKYAEHALPYALSIADKYDAELLMVHVVTLWEYDPANPEWRFPQLPEEQRQAIEAGAREELEAQLERADSGKVKVETRLVRGFDPAVELVRTGEEADADLIVMATHGRTGLRHALLGSVAEKVVRLASCPVLTVKHPEHDFLTDRTASGTAP